MPPFGPIKRKELVKTLRKIGFQGPYSGGRHQFMARDGQRIRIPNPHKTDIGRSLLAMLLKEAGLSKRDWESV